ncbi:MAG: hypothetical protein LV479_04415 [Methylacidiphilales bacterium]|nr:hypothetical protein [Candidatus Methylacidiphilales bacterium]
MKLIEKQLGTAFMSSNWPKLLKAVKRVGSRDAIQGLYEFLLIKEISSDVVWRNLALVVDRGPSRMNAHDHKLLVAFLVSFACQYAYTLSARRRCHVDPKVVWLIRIELLKNAQMIFDVTDLELMDFNPLGYDENLANMIFLWACAGARINLGWWVFGAVVRCNLEMAGYLASKMSAAELKDVRKSVAGPNAHILEEAIAKWAKLSPGGTGHTSTGSVATTEPMTTVLDLV